MLIFLKSWIKRYFSDQEALVLLFLLIFGFVVILTMGKMLTPVFAALVLAFLLYSFVNVLKSYGFSHLLSVSIVFTIFIALFSVSIFLLIPIMWHQLTTLANELPNMMNKVQGFLRQLPVNFPDIISEQDIVVISKRLSEYISSFGTWLVSFSLANISSIIMVLVYLVIVPILIFFFLKDKELLLKWIQDKLPQKRNLINQVSSEMHSQIASYIRGKAIEIVIVGSVSFITFSFFSLNYAVLLAILVGLSVIVPYIGATVVTVPVIMIALLQWGVEQQFVMITVIYFIIQAIDGNILVPLLFSEVVNLHPIAIIVAILVFGGFWGFWGVFFAIPLATLMKAVLNAWPKVSID